MIRAIGAAGPASDLAEQPTAGRLRIGAEAEVDYQAGVLLFGDFTFVRDHVLNRLGQFVFGHAVDAQHSGELAPGQTAIGVAVR